MRIIIFLCILVGFRGHSQSLSFSYDVAGNQINRVIIFNFQDYEPEVLKETDVVFKKFEATDAFSYYPNPVEKLLKIKWDNIESIGTDLILYDINGKELLRKNITKDEQLTQIDMLNYPKGVYLLQINFTEKETVTLKIIKK